MLAFTYPFFLWGLLALAAPLRFICSTGSV